MRVDLRDQLAGNVFGQPTTLERPRRTTALLFSLAAIAAPVLGEAQPSLSITSVGRLLRHLVACLGLAAAVFWIRAASHQRFTNSISNGAIMGPGVCLAQKRALRHLKKAPDYGVTTSPVTSRKMEPEGSDAGT